MDHKIEVTLLNEQARLDILTIRVAPVNKGGDIDYEAIVKVGILFNFADGAVVTEAGMLAIRDDQDYVTLRKLLGRLERRKSTKVSFFLY